MMTEEEAQQKIAKRRAIWAAWLTADENPPAQRGIYAILIAWPSDPFEGYLPGAGTWLGDKWKSDDPVSHRSPKPFASEDEANAWAYEHDPEC